MYVFSTVLEIIADGDKHLKTSRAATWIEWLHQSLCLRCRTPSGSANISDTLDLDIHRTVFEYGSSFNSTRTSMPHDEQMPDEQRIVELPFRDSHEAR